MSDYGTAPKKFSQLAGQVLVWTVVGYVVNFFVPTAPIAVVVNVIGMWRLYKTAQSYAAGEVEGFDSTVAAEAIVGFGIMALVLGLVTVALLFSMGRLEVQTASGQLTLLGAMPFIEGLFTAGIAPSFAILLRLSVAEAGESVNPADDMASLARAASSLTRTLTASHAALEQFQSGASAAATSTSTLASVMEAEVGRWGMALQEGGAFAKGFGSASKTASSDVAELSDQAVRLKAAVTASTNLLEELNRLIASVERFVAPPAGGPI